MIDFLKTYKARPWPRLEVPPMKRANLLALVLLTVGLIAAGWYIWFSGPIQVEYFIALGLVIPLAFFLKSRFIALIGLLCFQVILAFIFIGNSDYAIIPIVVLIGAIIAFESPMVIYVLLVFAIWADIAIVGVTHQNRATMIASAGLFLGWLFREVLRSTSVKRAIHFPEFLPAIILLGWAIIGSFIWGLIPFSEAWENLKTLIVSTTIFSVSVLIINNSRKVYFAFYTWICIGLYAALFVFFGPMLGYQPPDIEAWGAAYSIFGAHKNWIASILGLSFFLNLAAIYQVKKMFLKIGLSLCLVTVFFALVYQQSKGALAGLVVGLIFFWIVDSIESWRNKGPLRAVSRIFLFFSLLLIIAMFIYLIGVSEYLGGYYPLFFEPLSTPTMQARIMLWNISYHILSNESHIIRGLGFGAFEFLGPYYNMPPEIAEGIYVHPHSLYLDIIIHLGIVGLALFLWIVISILIKLWRSYVNASDPKYRYLCLGLLCGTLSFCMHCVIDFEVAHIVSFWLFMGLCVAAINVYKMNNSSANAEWSVQ